MTRSGRASALLCKRSSMLGFYLGLNWPYHNSGKTGGSPARCSHWPPGGALVIEPRCLVALEQNSCVSLRADALELGVSGLSKLCIYDRSDVDGAEERFDHVSFW